MSAGSDFSPLPAEAVASIGRIERLLDEARPLLGRGGSDEAGFALGETERRYLPDTIASFRAVPPSLRDAATVEMFVGQLALLERATRDRLASLANAVEIDLAANGAFLSERFADVARRDVADDPALAPASPARADLAERPSTTLVRRFFDEIERAAGPDPKALLTQTAERFSRAFPALVTVRKAGVFGGSIAGVAIDVPAANAVLRYALENGRAGLGATVTRIVRGVALRTEAVDVETWAAALLEDLSDFVDRDRAANAALTRLFSR